MAKEVVGTEVKWDWDLPRTKEGYYHYKGGVAVSRLSTPAYREPR